MSVFLDSIISWLSASQDYFQHLGWLGLLLFAAVMCAVQLTLAPLSPLAMTAGLIFGLGRGLIAVVIGTAAGVAVNFLIARYVARGYVAKRFGRSEKFRVIDAAIGREGWKIVALLRLCPIPFGLSNFCYGLTAIRFWPYFFASVVGIIPGNFVFTWMGASAHEGLDALAGGSRPHQPVEYALMFLGVAAAFVALMYISRIARAAVANHGDAAAFEAAEKAAAAKNRE